MTKAIVAGIGAILLFAAYSDMGYAAEPQTKEKALKDAVADKTTVQARDVEGVVAGISPTFIAIDYGRDAKSGALQEMALQIDPSKIQISHKQKLSEIKPGDSVRVSFDEITTIDASGVKTLRRVSRIVMFLSSPQRQPEVKEVSQSGPDAGAIPIKGLKGD